MIVAAGTSSCSSSRRFDNSSTFNLVTPVTLPLIDWEGHRPHLNTSSLVDRLKLIKRELDGLPKSA
jgi:hypothetical protein